MKEKIYVEINGIKLGIVTEDGQEYVERIAEELRDKINAIIKAQRNCTLIEASLFTALNLQSKSDEDDKKIKNLVFFALFFYFFCKNTPKRKNK